MKDYIRLFFKKKKDSLVGIDLTTHDIKIVELTKIGQGKFRLDGYAYRELPGGLVSDDVVVDTEQVGQIIKDLCEDNKIVTKDVAVSVPQNTVITTNIIVSGENEREIEAEIDNSGKKYINYDIDEVEYDFKILSDNTEQNNKNVLLVACKKKNITSRDDAVIISGLEPSIIDNEAYVYERIFPVLVGQVRHETGSQENSVHSILLVELFEKKIKTVLVRNGRTIYNEEHSIDIERRSLKTISLEDDSNSNSNNYKRGVLNSINKVMNLIDSSIDGNNLISCIMFNGQDKYIDDVKDYVEDKLNLCCLAANPLSGMEISSKINITDLALKAPLLVVACGLAMRENKYD